MSFGAAGLVESDESGMELDTKHDGGLTATQFSDVKYYKTRLLKPGARCFNRTHATFRHSQQLAEYSHKIQTQLAWNVSKGTVSSTSSLIQNASVSSKHQR